MRLLLDEHISPALVARLAQVGVYGEQTEHEPRLRHPAVQPGRHALDHDFAVVTTNVRDFIVLLDIEIHPGLIVLRESGLSRDEQWARLEPVVRYVLQTTDSDYLVNKLIEVVDAGKFSVREMPSR